MSRMVGDRCVLIVLTAAPWRWRNYLRAWSRTGVEWVVCSEVSGSGGLLTIAADHVGFNDLLAVVTDLDGMELVAEAKYHDPELPKCPIVEIHPEYIKGDFEAYTAQYRTIHDAWMEQSWPETYALTKPSPDELVAWCIGWWAGAQTSLFGGA